MRAPRPNHERGSGVAGVTGTWLPPLTTFNSIKLHLTIIRLSNFDPHRNMPLRFRPSSHYAFSNFEYASPICHSSIIMRRAIEHVSNQSFHIPVEPAATAFWTAVGARVDRVRCCSTRVHVLRETHSFAPLTDTCTRYSYNNNTCKDRSIVSTV